VLYRPIPNFFLQRAGCADGLVATPEKPKADQVHGVIDVYCVLLNIH